MTTSVEPGLLDANVLVYAVNADVAEHRASQALVDAARDPAVTLYVTSQVICEFYSVITNPRRVALPCSPSEGQMYVAALLDLPGIHVLPSPAASVAVLRDLLRRHPVTGAEVFDLQLAAIMLVNRVTRIYTFNVADFEVFPELTIVVP